MLVRENVCYTQELFTAASIYRKPMTSSQNNRLIDASWIQN